MCFRKKNEWDKRLENGPRSGQPVSMKMIYIREIIKKMPGWNMCERFVDVVANTKIKYARNQQCMLNYTHTESITVILKYISQEFLICSKMVTL